MKPRKFAVTDRVDWKDAILHQLQAHERTRYNFVRAVEAGGICSRHTAECLLAGYGTRTGEREPSFGVACEIARCAGYELQFVPCRKPTLWEAEP